MAYCNGLSCGSGRQRRRRRTSMEGMQILNTQMQIVNGREKSALLTRRGLQGEEGIAGWEEDYRIGRE